MPPGRAESPAGNGPGARWPWADRRTCAKSADIRTRYPASCGSCPHTVPAGDCVPRRAETSASFLEALSMAAVLNKELGLSHARTARVLELGYGLKWSRSGVCRALARLGNL